jgi:hypothetical protein
MGTLFGFGFIAFVMYVIFYAYGWTGIFIVIIAFATLIGLCSIFYKPEPSLKIDVDDSIGCHCNRPADCMKCDIRYRCDWA